MMPKQVHLLLTGGLQLNCNINKLSFNEQFTRRLFASLRFYWVRFWATIWCTIHRLHACKFFRGCFAKHLGVLFSNSFSSRSPSQDARLPEGIQPLTSPKRPGVILPTSGRSPRQIGRFWGCSYQKVLCLSQYAYFSESPAMAISKPKHCFC